MLRKNWLPFFLVTFGLVLSFCLCTSAVYAQSDDTVRIIVKYNQDHDQKIHTQSNEKVLKKTPHKDGEVYILKVAEKQASSRIKELRKETDVQFAELDTPVYAWGEAEKDPLFSKQFQFFKDVNIDQSWYNDQNSTGVTVAVIDSGVDEDHPDLKGSLVKGYNVLEPGKLPEDYFGHGTHIAGLVGAGTFNGIGISSISKGAKIMPIKVIEAREGYMSDVAQGINYAVDHGADIINLSLGGYSNSEYMQEAVEYANNAGVLVIAAAGNDDVDRTTFPAAFSSVLSVGATETGTQKRADFSNYGPNIDVAAPGSHIYSTYLDGSYEYLDGTSMATPIVVSLAARLKAAAPYLTSEQIKTLLSKGAHPLTEEAQLGEGLINAGRSKQLINENNRIAGTTSVETSLAISKNGWDSLEETNYKANGESYTGKFVVMATADRFPDSLAATPLANQLKSPILLVKNNQITSEHVKELKRLKTDYVVLTGGPGALSSEVKEKLNENGIKTIRVAGDTRYKTSIAIDKTLTFNSEKAIIVTGENFPDAVSVAAYAQNAQMPIIFVKENKVPTVVKNYIQSEKFNSGIVIGGSGAISDRAVGDLGITTSRVNGTNRYETSFQVLLHFSPSEGNLYFATGEKYNDALTGAALAGKQKDRVLLVPPKKIDKTIQQELTYLHYHKGQTYHILGGPGAISPQSAWTIDRYVNGY
ncbi:S8 family serine peptidase [Halobacillus rhizosphaerae]|uniref:S8 family serine peptidase n=1 Tax=Halobacillus rhizosphaerae TaxID=3064889 RepID=UPI00398B2339